MTRVSIDEKICDIQTQVGQKLGEVLTAVTLQLPENRVITQISLNGKPLPKYASLGSLDEDIQAIEQLEIRTADRAIWAANGIDIALSCIERVQKSLLRTAEMFREFQIGDANRLFAHCMEGMERFLETIVISRCAIRLDFSQIKIDGRTLASVENDLLSILAGILIAQEKSDSAAIAEKVEYELLPNLCAWSTALRQLRLSQLSNA